MYSRASHIAIWAWAVAAAVATAQIPRDPLTDRPAAAPPAGGTTSAKQLPPAFVTKQSEVEIPFNVRSGTSPESQPSSVRVFVSWDRGQTWHFYDERKPEDARFRFRAKQDGEFWFATQTMDRSGRPDSAEPRTPQLRLVIDTKRPQLLVQAHVTASGTVNLAWSAADATLATSSLKLEYQDAAGNGGSWLPIELSGPITASTVVTGQTSFEPVVNSRAINLRAEVTDGAGNMAYYSQRLALTPPKPKAPAGGLAVDPSATRWPTTNLPDGNQTDGQLADNAGMSAVNENEQVRIPNVVENPFVGPGRLASNRPAVDSLPPPANHSPPAAPEVAPLPSESGGSGSKPTDVGSSTETLPIQPAMPPPSPRAEVMPAPQPVEQVEAPTAQRPRLTNSRRFSLDYDIQSVGPEGVSSVELWGTTDRGRTWTKWGTDPDKASPFDVEVNHEATYGFRIVVVGKNGLATSSPQTGDAADIWVGVDLTRPNAKLTGAAYGQAEAAGKLDIRWHADDTNLGSRPITLSIGDRPDGRFTPLATGLPNTGQYFWEYDPRSPRQIYLRLEARDEAGNIAIDQLTEPIKVEGLEPKGQIRGFKAGPENNRGGSRAPVRR